MPYYHISILHVNTDSVVWLPWRELQVTHLFKAQPTLGHFKRQLRYNKFTSGDSPTKQFIRTYLTCVKIELLPQSLADAVHTTLEQASG